MINLTRKKKQEKRKAYTNSNIFIKLIFFFYMKLIDSYRKMKEGKTFDEYGLTMYCGRQGAGKTIAMTDYLERMREKYPNALIITNYGYKYQNGEMKDWEDFFSIRNGTDGVIFAIDEIQNEFSSAAWNKFPESLLSEITQQRKQRVKIVCTSQIYTRVVKQLREQCNDVVECNTFGGRWTFTRCYDAVDYNNVIDRPTARENIRRLYTRSFLQDDYIRNCFDTYQKIEKMQQTEYLGKSERAKVS